MFSVLCPPEKLIVCITQTGPSLPYHCYWGEKIQMHRLSPPRPPLPSPLFPFLSSLSLYHHTDGIRRWGLASKESGCVAGETFHATRVQILKHLLFTNSFKCSNKKYIYSVFLNYDSSVKAITFVDNHLILVLSSCFFLFLFLLLTFW